MKGLDVYPAGSLIEVIKFLSGEQEIAPAGNSRAKAADHVDEYADDFMDVRGQEHVKRALEVAVSDG